MALQLVPEYTAIAASTLASVKLRSILKCPEAGTMNLNHTSFPEKEFIIQLGASTPQLPVVPTVVELTMLHVEPTVKTVAPH